MSEPTIGVKLVSPNLWQVTFACNASVWRRISKEAAKRGCSTGVVIAAAMDAYDETTHSANPQVHRDG